MNKDVYFLKKWQELYAKREGYELKSVNFECEYGNVEYNFLIRPITINEKKYSYYDIVTPYAFSGPLIECKSENNREKLVQMFDIFFSKYCEKENIVAEYVQFNPWVGNDVDFNKYYELSFRSTIAGIDLSKKDLLYDEFDSRRRRAIRNAEKNNVEFKIDYEGKMIDEFLRIYNYTIDKYNVIDYYKFDKNFISSLFEELKGNIYFAYCLYNERCSSICIVLTSNNYAHYYLAGHDPNLKHSNSGSLLIYKIAEKEKLEGKKVFILGGADGNMLEFKKSFTHNCYYKYYVGTRIRNKKIYDYLSKENGNIDTQYFPSYRFNNNMEYFSWTKGDEKNE